jgi:ribosome recycling factor
MIVKEVIKETEGKMKGTIDSALREFSEVRTGRAHPGLIEGMHVDYYGTLTLVKELASITVPDPKTIIIQPWDATVIPELEKAISQSALGITPQNDGKIVRLNVPPLSEERREEMTKVVRDMAEKAKVSLRNVRRDANDKLKKMEGDKSISEDEGYKAHDSVQKITDQYIKEIEQLLSEKSKQLMN